MLLRVRNAALAGLMLISASGCSGSNDTDAIAGGENNFSAQLAIEYQPSPGGSLQNFTLSCISSTEGQGAGIDTPTACGWLANNQDELSLVRDSEESCTMVFGGSQAMRVTGSVSGRDIEVFLRRANGCEIAQWDRWDSFIVAVTGQRAADMAIIE